jgi:hypothetical protein
MRAVMLALTSISDPDREEEFNTWYDTIHAPQALGIPGIVACRRFKLAPTQILDSGLAPFIAVYEIEADKVEAVTNDVLELMKSGSFTTTELMSGGTMAFFEPLSELEA